MLVINENTFDKSIEDLRGLQKWLKNIGDTPGAKLVEGIINNLNHNAVDLNSSVTKGSKLIREDM
jgi:hypothetical protein